MTDKSLCKYYLFYFKILKITASATFTGTDFSEEAGLAILFSFKICPAFNLHLFNENPRLQIFHIGVKTFMN